MLTRGWFSSVEIAAMRLPGMPSTPAGMLIRADAEGWKHPDKQGLTWRPRVGRGGGFEYHHSLFPNEAQARLLLIHGKPSKDAKPRETKTDRGALWAWYEQLPEHKRTAAETRLKALQTIEAMEGAGTQRELAIMHVAHEIGAGKSTVYTWFKQVYGVDRADWAPHLAPRHAGRSGRVECSEEAWDFLLADYLRPAQRTFVACYDDLVEAAAKNGWTIPSAKTLERRIKELPPQIVILKREGAEALKKTYPSQERDHSVFHALEAVNADGHTWDVFVKYPDGTVDRPIMVGYQDIYSGMLLSWRFARSETAEVVRLAFGDVIEKYGIPRLCWFDNGRAFASKKITGGMEKRNRFKVKQEDPEGIMKTLGVEVRWATPYHGQAKPIERFWRNVAGRIAKDIRFDKAYSGANPMAKPADYAQHAVPYDLFLKVANEGLAAENARLGRRSKVCQGRSFLDTFNESYAASTISKATAAQRRLWLLAAEGITAGKQDGSLSLMGNRYWADFLVSHRRTKLMVRFDPERLHQPLHVYRLDGAYLGEAACQEAAGFDSAEAAHEYARDKGAYLRGVRLMAEAEKRMTTAQAVKLMAIKEEPEAPTPETRVVRLVTRGATALQPVAEEEEEFDPRQERVVGAIAQMNRVRTGHLRAVVSTDGDD